jgi:hypothetical protein
MDAEQLKQGLKELRRELAAIPPRCHAAGRNSDGDCYWSQCPQLRDGEPGKTGRHCPLDVGDADMD